MARAGRKRINAVREPSGKVSRRTADQHARGGDYACWLVYFATAGGFTKVGYSGQVRQRLGNIGREVGATCRLMGAIQVPDEAAARSAEKEIHAHLDAKGFRYDREWFDMDDKDVISTLALFRHLGDVITSIEGPAAAPRKIFSPKHHFSDAKGRKFSAGY